MERASDRWRPNSRAPHVSAGQAQAPDFFAATQASRSPVQTACTIMCSSRDGGDVERFLKDLHDRCWLHGFGWHLIGGAGQLLDRSIVDRMVGFGERFALKARLCLLRRWRRMRRSACLKCSRATPSAQIWPCPG